MPLPFPTSDGQKFKMGTSKSIETAEAESDNLSIPARQALSAEQPRVAHLKPDKDFGKSAVFVLK